MASDLGSSENTYLVVYIRFVVNRVAFYVPLLEDPPRVPKGLVQQRHGSRFLKYPMIKESWFPKLAWWVNNASGCCLELPPMLWLVIALLGLSVHGRLFASRSKIVE